MDPYRAAGNRGSTPHSASDAGSYRAFISYSHQDARIARWLHRQLESYKVPPRLVGRATASGLLGKTVGKIFRDRDELSVSADLSGQINEALHRSQFLIVLCSPASARSKWVNQEIVNFKRLKGPESIIAVILEGEPFSTGMPGREAEECFAPALRFQVTENGELSARPAEPVAADLRPGKDGERLAKMKVLAGLLGVELDELIRREVQRRNKQLFALSCVMAAVVVAMTVLSILAVTSRNEAIVARDAARRQKDQAEGLIDFMLGDLRDKLKPVGRLDSLEAVGSQAQRYFESLRPDEIDSQAKARLARTKLLSGEVLYSQGRAKDAAGQFDEAYAMTSALHDADPQNSERIFDHAQSEYWVGYGNFRNARYADAERNFIKYRAFAARLVDSQPDNLIWRAELASALTNLGAVRIRMSRTSEALEDFTLAAHSQQQVIAQQPPLASFVKEADKSKQQTKLVGLNIDLGQILAWGADAERAIGKIDDAIVLRERELEVYREVERLDPKNTTLTQARLVALASRGGMLMEKGRPSEALEDFRSATLIGDGLGRADRENKWWAQLMARSNIGAAEALLDLGQLEESRRRIQTAMLIGREIAGIPNINRAGSIRVMGNLLMVSARRDFADASYSLAKAGLDELLRLTDDILSGTPDEPESLLLKAEGNLLAGDIDVATGRAPHAVDYWREALAITDRVGTATNARAAVLGALARKRLKDQQGLTALLLPICASGYRRSEFKELCRQ